MLRHGRRYPGRSHWTKTHLKWLADQKFEQPSQQICLDEYVEAVKQATARVQRLEAQVRELVSVWSLGPVVSAMTAHRGVSLVVAATVTFGVCSSRPRGPTVIRPAELPTYDEASRANPRRFRRSRGKVRSDCAAGTVG